MSFFKTLLFVVGIILLVRSTIFATQFSVVNETERSVVNGKEYDHSVFIREVSDFPEELSPSEKYSYTGPKNEFSIRIRRYFDYLPLAFLHIILPKTTTEKFTFTIKYKDPDFELNFLDNQTIIIPPAGRNVLDLSKKPLKNPISEIKKALPSKRVEEVNDQSDYQKEEPTSYAPSTTTPAYATTYKTSASTPS